MYLIFSYANLLICFCLSARGNNTVGPRSGGQSGSAGSQRDTTYEIVNKTGKTVNAKISHE